MIDVQRDANGAVQSIRMPRPSNFHAHLRSDALMKATAFETMRWVKYLLVMPNTGPIDTVLEMVAYHGLLEEIARSMGLRPSLVMTLYLTEFTTPKIIEQLALQHFPCGVKYYPPHKGATTGSGLGVSLDDAHETLSAMEEAGIRLLGHFESVYDKRGRELPHEAREDYFMEHEFPRLREAYPNLHINIEHASTARAVAHVQNDTTGKTTCGITPQHLLFTNSDFQKYTWRNHLRCMPIVKGEDNRAALVEFATSGDARVHLGDDTAPHLSKTKEGSFEEAACGCWLPHSLSLYALAFERAGALDERFVQFTCYNGPDAWELDRPTAKEAIRLVADDAYDIPEPTYVPEAQDVVIPLGWSMQDDPFELGIRLDM